MVKYQDGMSAGAALAAAGITEVPGTKALSVDGRRAQAGTPVRAGSTVAMQPKAYNG
jgi:hypothetical protein